MAMDNDYDYDYDGCCGSGVHASHTINVMIILDVMLLLICVDMLLECVRHS